MIARFPKEIRKAYQAGSGPVREIMNKAIGGDHMSKLKLEIDLKIPSLKTFEPQQTTQALWEILKDYDFEPLEEIEGINVARFSFSTL